MFGALARLHSDERGVALSTVIVLGVVLMGLTGATMSYAVGSMNISRRDQDWNAALAAAETGIDDYINRANHDGAYWAFGPGPDGVYQAGEQTPADGNQAFTDWVPVPGPENEGQYRYTVDSTQITENGSVTITSTGRVRNATRTVRATLRPRNFLDYLYFTNYETIDPVLYPIYYGIDSSTAETYCGDMYDYDDGDNERANWCRPIQFATGDVIKGPLHTNDRMWINGDTEFLGRTSTTYPGDSNGKRWYGGGNPTFAVDGDPKVAEVLTMPSTNEELKARTDPALGATGCLYSGPTTITLKPNGTMDVWSPFSSAGNCAYGTAGPQNVPLPTNGVIYVENALSSAGSCQPNKNYFGYPKRISASVYDLTKYGCYDGDVFLSGQLKGRLTIAAENKVVVTGDTTYVGGASGNDVLGLIPKNYVEIYHPVDCVDWNGSQCGTQYNDRTDMDVDLSQSGNQYLRDVKLWAAILSLNHSFTVQNFGYGQHNRLGQLSVFGAIAQKYRGPVGTGGASPTTGYLKDYVYDQRLKYISPPHFMDPVNSAWHVATWAEISTPPEHDV